MLQDAKERTIWKARLAEWVDSATDWVTCPVRKLMAEVTFGVLSSGSLRQSEIARALCEPMRLHHTQKRLSRMLVGHSEVAWAAEQVQLERMGPRVTERMILAIDPGDLNRDGAACSEYRGRVRDGDTGEIVGGYPLMSVVARDLDSGQTLPLLTRLLSSARAGHRSENTDVLSVMETVQRHVSGTPLWVIDRGGDRGRLWRHWLEQDWPVLVRAANQRYWLWRDGAHTAQQIARQLPLKHQGKLRRGGARTVRFGLTRVSLREHPERPLSMVVVRHGKREPLVLVSTRRVRGRRQGERLIQAYLDRWACEEGYRFTKQGFQLEGVQARRFSVLQNLVALASLAWALLAAYQAQAGHLMDKARRQKRGNYPIFPFYSLLAGWQRLFQSARRVYYHWWRQPHRPKAPIIPDLFADSPTLIPIRS
ncbi:transposase [Alkalilimnicola ehrlichii]|uniref:transposase n=1 Tax=Alkalilimnicola ehrlichii TaxID=351052 RepID=UPI003BA24627